MMTEFSFLGERSL